MVYPWSGSRWLGKHFLFAWDACHKSVWLLPCIILNHGECLNGVEIGWLWWSIGFNWQTRTARKSLEDAQHD